ncbi:MAG: bifunctional non-ous end joining protein LigD [Pseudonocardiales bacterium]|jgi:bifunctional non-homologous end joining protein LigD|nr:bifunctional non-ous end joining protein LigD [Pseudonocardiales bacterium]
MAALDEYRRKRNPKRTPEPIPRATRGATKKRGTKNGGNSFVIQEHHASALHWDFRLERDGVLVSWAVPKGVPPDPKVNHLAVHTEDHPLEYASFEGTIADGEYGGGKVTVWDRGTYETEKWTDREVKVVLHGERAQGRFVLFQTGGKNWMIHRMDAPARPDWQPLPEHLSPMLATLGEPPQADAGWAFEMKWDGVRAIVRVDGGRITLTSRNDKDMTVSYPELRALGEALGTTQVLLDGEIVTFDDDGRPSFGKLQQRMHVASTAAARRLAQSDPAVLLIFDLLHIDGRSLLDVAYRERRELLDELGLSGPSWQTPPAFAGSGAAAVRASIEQRLEGVVAKRMESRYLPGRRSPDWVKIKNIRTQEVVVGGWRTGKGRREATIGSLLLGIPDEDGLRYVGQVGTGFTQQILDDLLARLNRLSRKSSPFRPDVPRADARDAQWVTPKLVGEVAFSEWTADERLRHPSWRGLRPDKTAGDVVRES